MANLTKVREPYAEELYLVHLRACMFSGCAQLDVDLLAGLVAALAWHVDVLLDKAIFSPSDVTKRDASGW